jgi:hypothetical protein
LALCSSRVSLPPVCSQTSLASTGPTQSALTSLISAPHGPLVHAAPAQAPKPPTERPLWLELLWYKERQWEGRGGRCIFKANRPGSPTGCRL